MVNKFSLITYSAPIFNYIEKLNISDFNSYPKEKIIFSRSDSSENKNELVSIHLFNNFRFSVSFNEEYFYEKVYFKDKNIDTLERTYKELSEKEVLNSFYSMIYFLLADNEESNKLFYQTKLDITFMEKLQLFIMTNPSNYLDLKIYELDNYSILLYKNFTNDNHEVIIIDNSTFKNKYLLFNTYDETNFITKKNISSNDFILFINEYIKGIKNNITLKNELNNFLLLSIS